MRNREIEKDDLVMWAQERPKRPLLLDTSQTKVGKPFPAPGRVVMSLNVGGQQGYLVLDEEQTRQLALDLVEMSLAARFLRHAETAHEVSKSAIDSAKKGSRHG
ncbi:MAG: hypothetical protein Q4F13_02680 [Pseudomonadota bacterium]|nr:hypothetical protein [Pseudomonadota bacterium]